ncbi:uncharacterized protein LOC129602590 [Paramacrobiotus metropolitanus]|uniref:uncharacterized protein LOC129602590 n=1 Tax=Paramacrobiotus metropolitanus TaxID=2943436 RepID=UPI0024461373|nr:uncharacterized protein LOC129602590 [Paramacrobiotus metropolitanus]XP_055357626.1 uncharacterized protein LOC129602590 [Paramacrobiotus metropolitanus]XP_055357627.1 uncharacterized protein LOC129602590 [Paramacrobiotus metropolitanus]
MQENNAQATSVDTDSNAGETRIENVSVREKSRSRSDLRDSDPVDPIPRRSLSIVSSRSNTSQRSPDEDADSRRKSGQNVDDSGRETTERKPASPAHSEIPSTSGTGSAPHTCEKPRFRKEEQVYVKTVTCMGSACDPYWYTGRIIGVGKGNYDKHDGTAPAVVPCYKIHYHNSSSSYDEWVFGDCLMSATSMENQYLAARDNARYYAKTKSSYSVRKGKKKGRDDTPSSDASYRSSVESEKATSRKKRRGK